MDSSENCLNEEKTVEDHVLLSPRRSCDSAYGSCMDSGSGVQQDDICPGLSLTDTDLISGDCSFGAVSDDSPEPINFGASLSVGFNGKKCHSPYSSSSSIASDSANESKITSDEATSESSGIQPDKDTFTFKKFSSASNFSLRSSLSFEESEASGDDCLSPRFKKKVKARRSWKKLQRMVVWSPFMQSYKKKYPWVQLAGHAGNFQPGEEGCILKKYVEREANCLKGLTEDPTLCEYSPTYHGVVETADEKYTRMEDLLLPFDQPSLMDCKMGVRTYLEDELAKAKVNPRLRQDMYDKMVEISPDAPTKEERRQRAVTKPRYMQWREQVSSTSNLGFRIEGIKKGNLDPSKAYKLTKTEDQVMEAFMYFIDGNVVVLEKYIARLKRMRVALEKSFFWHNHEAIGSSLLFVHDDSSLANVWMIDFGKTSRLPSNQSLDHRSDWIEGNREDGYLFGMDNLLRIFERMLHGLKCEKNTSSDSSTIATTSASQVQITITAPSSTQNKADSIRQESRVHFDESSSPCKEIPNRNAGYTKTDCYTHNERT